MHDLTSRININDGTGWAAGHAFNVHLARTLNELGKRVGVSTSTLRDDRASLGCKILDNRPAAGFSTLEEVATMAGISKDDLETIQAHVTVLGWRDPEHMRSPVNVNGASKEVLTVLLLPLTASASAVSDEIFACREGKGTYASTEFGGRFRIWSQFNAFCDDLVKRRIISDAEGALIKETFNPNKPEGHQSQVVSELTFNEAGFFAIDSTGTIPNGGNPVESRLRVSVKLYDVIR